MSTDGTGLEKVAELDERIGEIERRHAAEDRAAAERDAFERGKRIGRFESPRASLGTEILAGIGLACVTAWLVGLVLDACRES